MTRRPKVRTPTARHAQAPPKLRRHLVWWIENDETDPDEIVRFWIPLFDVAMIVGGVWAAVFGSPILHRLFPHVLVDVAGIGMTVAAALALFGVVVPRYAMLELTGKLFLLFFLGSYTACVAFFPSDPGASNGFLVILLIAFQCLIYPQVRRVYRKPAVQHDLVALRRALRGRRK